MEFGRKRGERGRERERKNREKREIKITKQYKKLFMHRLKNKNATVFFVASLEATVDRYIQEKMQQLFLIESNKHETNEMSATHDKEADPSFDDILTIQKR